MILKRGLVFTGDCRGEQHPGGSRRTSEKLNCDLDAVRLGLVPWGGPVLGGPFPLFCSEAQRQAFVCTPLWSRDAGRLRA